MMIFKNVALKKKVRMSNWRKSTIGTWSQTGDCQVYCIQSINIEPALNWIASQNDKITLTHLAGRACGLMIKKYPQINSLIRFTSLYQREEVSIFFQVAVDELGEDLTGHTVRKIDELSVSEIAKDMQSVVQRIKKGDDVNYKKVKGTLGLIPSFLVKPFISIYGFILYSLNLWSPLFGAPKDCFGSMMITNVGTLDMQTALVPLVPYSHCPLILALGKVHDKPVVKNAEIVIQKSIDCGWTLDHRIIDGVVGAKMAKYFKELMENPERLEIK